jgi:hypothetical protein
MAKRIDDSSSTVASTAGRRVFILIPAVLVVLMRTLSQKGLAAEYQQKGQPAHAAALFSIFTD